MFYRFAHVLRCVSVIEAHNAAVKSVAFISEGPSLITGSVDKTIKVWNMAANPPVSQKIDADGEVQHLLVTAGNYLMWANSVMPAYSPSDPVGIVELMNIASTARSKCVVNI